MAKNKRFYAKLAIMAALALFVAAPRVFADNYSYSYSDSHSSSDNGGFMTEGQKEHQVQWQVQQAKMDVQHDSESNVDVHNDVDVHANAEANVCTDCNHNDHSDHNVCTNCDQNDHSDHNDHYSNDHKDSCDHGCDDHETVVKKVYKIYKEVVINRLPVTGPSLFGILGIVLAAAVVTLVTRKALRRA